MASSLTVQAFAKINLDLQVIGLRPDGYHELRTTFQSIALADRLTFTVTRGPFYIECDDPAVPTDQTNLIWKAAVQVLAMARRRDPPFGVAVRVEKNIPMQAGLGGGSSDGAAALRALCKLWKVKPTPEQLQHAAARLGADVPYFLEGGTALGFHRGDVLFPLDDIPKAWVVIVVPDFGVSTKDAFDWWDQEVHLKVDTTGATIAPAGSVVSAFRRTNASNDLQKVVAKRHPIVGKLVRTLNKAGASHASLSGSGSAVFGLFSTQSAAQAAARKLAGPRTFVTPTLTRRACQRLAAK